METDPGELAQAGQATARTTVRERISTWLTFALLMAFFIVTIALWGYAVWWGVAKLFSLIF